MIRSLINSNNMQTNYKSLNKKEEKNVTLDKLIKIMNYAPNPTIEDFILNIANELFSIIKSVDYKNQIDRLANAINGLNDLNLDSNLKVSKEEVLNLIAHRHFYHINHLGATESFGRFIKEVMARIRGKDVNHVYEKCNLVTVSRKIYTLNKLNKIINCETIDNVAKDLFININRQILTLFKTNLNISQDFGGIVNSYIKELNDLVKIPNLKIHPLEIAELFSNLGNDYRCISKEYLDFLRKLRLENSDIFKQVIQGNEILLKKNNFEVICPLDAINKFFDYDCSIRNSHIKNNFSIDEIKEYKKSSVKFYAQIADKINSLDATNETKRQIVVDILNFINLCNFGLQQVYPQEYGMEFKELKQLMIPIQDRLQLTNEDVEKFIVNTLFANVNRRHIPNPLNYRCAAEIRVATEALVAFGSIGVAVSGIGMGVVCLLAMLAVTGYEIYSLSQDTSDDKINTDYRSTATIKKNKNALLNLKLDYKQIEEILKQIKSKNDIKNVLQRGRGLSLFNYASLIISPEFLINSNNQKIIAMIEAAMGNDINKESEGLLFKARLIENGETREIKLIIESKIMNFSSFETIYEVWQKLKNPLLKEQPIMAILKFSEDVYHLVDYTEHIELAKHIITNEKLTEKNIFVNYNLKEFLNCLEVLNLM